MDMTPACRALIEGVQQRAKQARRRARFMPRSARQAFIYDTTFRNEIEAVAYFLAENTGHVPDFTNPTLYSERLRGQFLTHPNPLLSIAADKIAMRAYCDLFDLPIRPPRLLATFDNPTDLIPAELPETCMIKISDGCKMNLLHAPGMPVTPFAYRRFLRQKWHIDHWRRHAELHYRDIPKRILVEEALLPVSAIREPMIFCAMGEPYLMIEETHRTALQDRLAPLEVTRQGRQSAPLSTYGTKPEIDAMLQTARLLSENLSHCRIDFMRIDTRLYLSEITISPRGYYVPLETPLHEELRCSLLDMSRLPELLEKGRKIAADLGRSTETSFGHFDATDPRLATGGQSESQMP
ncbi:MAG: hypothetical protein GYB25_12565 [Rhodobacteraceae bacterium]|nr:hypothetical protein [Paracoccaceae bacterium]